MKFGINLPRGFEKKKYFFFFFFFLYIVDGLTTHDKRRTRSLPHCNRSVSDRYPKSTRNMSRAELIDILVNTRVANANGLVDGIKNFGFKDKVKSHMAIVLP